VVVQEVLIVVFRDVHFHCEVIWCSRCQIIFHPVQFACRLLVEYHYRENKCNGQCQAGDHRHVHVLHELSFLALGASVLHEKQRFSIAAFVPKQVRTSQMLYNIACVDITSHFVFAVCCKGVLDPCLIQVI